MIDEKKRVLESALDESRQIFIKSESGEQREYNIKQPTLRKIYETSIILIGIEVNEIGDFLNGKKAFLFMFKHIDKIIDVISICLNEPDKAFLKENLTPSESYDIVINILQLIGVQDFQKSIIAISPMSLLNQRELIALSTHSSS